jgi:XTP/dITP diphosphohydrolase
VGGDLRRVVVASRNRGKVAELRRLLRPARWRLLELDQAPGGAELHWVEDGSSYLGNAAIKARAACAATELPSLGDDSGIEVGALGGWPGLLTARWLGEDATPAELLEGLASRVAQLPTEQRRGSFVCALVLAVPVPDQEPRLIMAEGRLEGVLLSRPRGERGFGYDPIFVPGGEQRTMAEMSQARKDEISHRGRAARRLLGKVRRSHLGGPGAA